MLYQFQAEVRSCSLPSSSASEKVQVASLMGSVISGLTSPSQASPVHEPEPNLSTTPIVSVTSHSLSSPPSLPAGFPPDS